MELCLILRKVLIYLRTGLFRLQLESLTQGIQLSLHISFNEKDRTVSVRDNGIGMAKAEVIDNIGTIARSGTRQFLDSLSGDQSADASLIGQFGVGFYSVFLVAEKVELLTRKAGQEPEAGVRWSSDGSGEYTIENSTRVERGTEITLHLRKEDKEFSEGNRLRNIIGKYSDHISLPIKMLSSDEKRNEEWETVNKGAALWSRPKTEITEGGILHIPYQNLSIEPFVFPAYVVFPAKRNCIRLIWI